MSSLPEAQTLIPVMALVLIFDSLRSFFFSVSRAEQQMHIESKNNIYTNILIVGISLAFMFVSRTALALTWGYAIGDGIGFIFMVIAVKKYIPNLLKHFSKDLFVHIFKSAWPFTIIAISNVIIFNTDTLFLGHFASVPEVGWYSASSRLIQALYILPTLFATATFPAMVKKMSATAEFTSAIKKSLIAVTAVMVPLVLIIFFVSPIIINILFGSAYAPSAIILAVLSLSYIPVFISSVLNNAVFALNKQKSFIVASIVGMIANIVFNIVLIPRFHAIGAAISIVLSLLIIMIITVVRLKKLTARLSL